MVFDNPEIEAGIAMADTMLTATQTDFLERFLGIILPEGFRDADVSGSKRDETDRTAGTSGLVAESSMPEAWAGVADRLEGVVIDAIKTGGDAASDLKLIWMMAQDLVAEGEFARALALLPRIGNLLQPQQVVEEPSKPAVEGRPPIGVVAFQRSRILWRDARLKLTAEARQLHDSIIASAKGDEDFEEIKAAAGAILTNVEGFDTTLEELLEEITETPEGRARESLKRETAQMVGSYIDMLREPFFVHMDANPFGAASAVAPARSALAVIQKTLL